MYKTLLESIRTLEELRIDKRDIGVVIDVQGVIIGAYEDGEIDDREYDALTYNLFYTVSKLLWPNGHS